MFKAILLITLITSCGALGIMKSQAYSRRVNQLNEVRDMMKILSTEISYRKDPLPVIFRKVADQRSNIASDILARCCHYMGQRHSFETCWQKSVDEVCTSSSLTSADKAVILDLGTQMGRSNVQGQQRVIMLAEEKLKAQISEALREKNSNGKMYGGLGFSIGIIIAVLLI